MKQQLIETYMGHSGTLREIWLETERTTSSGNPLTDELIEVPVPDQYIVPSDHGPSSGYYFGPSLDEARVAAKKAIEASNRLHAKIDLNKK